MFGEETRPTWSSGSRTCDLRKCATRTLTKAPFLECKEHRSLSLGRTLSSRLGFQFFHQQIPKTTMSPTTAEESGGSVQVTGSRCSGRILYKSSLPFSAQRVVSWTRTNSKYGLRLFSFPSTWRWASYSERVISYILRYYSLRKSCYDFTYDFFSISHHITILL